jgi:hypothetical protein
LKKKRLIPIPFNMMPASWGLSGQAYDEAEASYYYEGEALERKLVAIRVSPGPERDRRLLALDRDYKHITQYEYDCRMLEHEGLGSDPMSVLEVEYRHGRKTDYEYLEAKIRLTMTGKDRARALIELKLSEGDLSEYDAEKQLIELEDDTPERAAALIRLDIAHKKIEPYEAEKKLIPLQMPEGIERDIALLDVELKYEKIKPRQHEKDVATLKGEQWVGVIDDGFDLNQGINGLFFELDWNEHWITYLRMNGYGGQTEEQIIEAWFADVCRTYVSENSGETDFTPRPGRVINRFDSGNGSVHYT